MTTNLLGRDLPVRSFLFGRADDAEGQPGLAHRLTGRHVAQSALRSSRP